MNMKLDALTSIKKDALDTNALKSVTGGRRITKHTGAGHHVGLNADYSNDRTHWDVFVVKGVEELSYAGGYYSPVDDAY